MNEQDFELLKESIRQAGEIKRCSRKAEVVVTRMSTEHEFLRQRLALVEEWLVAEYNRDRPPANRDVAHEREARLLRKLQMQAKEGHVLTTVLAWREQLGKFLHEHRQRYKRMQNAYDDWWELPPYRRESTPQPSRPPRARFKDINGEPWIIDDSFLVLLDDLAERIRKWKREELE